MAQEILILIDGQQAPCLLLQGEKVIINFMKHNADVLLEGEKTTLPKTGFEMSVTETISQIQSNLGGTPLITKSLSGIMGMPKEIILPNAADIYLYVNGLTFSELSRNMTLLEKIETNAKTINVIMGDSGKSATRNEAGMVSCINQFVINLPA